MGNQILSSGERLRHLMDTRNIKNASQLSYEMFKAEIFESSETENLKDDIESYINNKAKSINNHLRDCVINAEWLKRYCDFFQCSADYLLGYISEPTHTITDIAAETGLWEKSIHFLKMVPEMTACINALISDDTSYKLCHDFSNLLFKGEKYRSDENLLKKIKKMLKIVPDNGEYNQIKDIYDKIERRRKDTEKEIKSELYEMGIIWGNFTRKISIGEAEKYDEILNDMLNENDLNAKVYKMHKDSDETIIQLMFGQNIDSDYPTGH